MNAVKTALQQASAHDRGSYRPLFFRLPGDAAALEVLLTSGQVVEVFDHLTGQLKELVRSLNPSVRYTSEELEAAAVAHLNGTDPLHYGVWVYFPWTRRLVHLLDEAEFALVRTDRNRNKITREEQAVLATKRVGVIGLSVGQSVSLTMALERSFGEIRLADFDELELSNLNRIRCGVHEMGIPKVVNTAREIAELDPFLKVTIYPEGITRANIDHFLTEGGKLDVLVEECDSVDVKIYARQKAKALGIPVVMDMSDRGCLDIERFDLEPDRPIMHGWIDHLDLDAASKAKTSEEKLPYMLPIVGVGTLSTRMKASMIEMGQTVGTWPQLATSVVLGGALAGDAARRIFNAQTHTSGRWYVDIEELVAPEPVSPPRSTKGSTTRPIARPREHNRAGQRLDAKVARDIAYAGSLAPSAGNAQPWKFIFDDGFLTLVQDLSRSENRWDPDQLLVHIAMGGCLENMHLRALAHGMSMTYGLDHSVDNGLSIPLSFAPYSSGESELTIALNSQIEKRCTNRRTYERERIPCEALSTLKESIDTLQGCSLHFFEDDTRLDEIADCCSGAERIRLLDRKGHEDFFRHELKWSDDEVRSSGDGLDVRTLELNESDMAALKVVSDEAAMDLIRLWGGGKALEKFSKRTIQRSAAIGLVCVQNYGIEQRVLGGRFVERVWLAAQQQKLSFHPISAPIFMNHAQELIQDLDASYREEIKTYFDRISTVFGLRNEQPLFLFRLNNGGEPTVRSLRRSLDSMFETIKEKSHA